MEMTRLEKWWVNRNKKGQRNIARVKQHRAELPTEAIAAIAFQRLNRYLKTTVLSRFTMKDATTDLFPSTILFGKIKRHNETQKPAFESSCGPGSTGTV